MLKIGIDMDGVLCNLCKGLRDQAHFERGIEIPDNPDDYWYKDQAPTGLVEELLAIPNVFYNLSPIPGAIGGINRLQEIAQVMIVTTPVLGSVRVFSEKVSWVRNHLGREWEAMMIFTQDKTLIDVDILYDDHPRIFGMQVPSWKQVFYPWNYNRENSPRMMWDQFVQYVEGLDERIFYPF